MSSLVIVCERCGARFRLDRARLKNMKAARVRCRKCGCYIVVRVPEEPPAPALPPQETIPPAIVEPAAPAPEPLSPWLAEPPVPAPEPVSPLPFADASPEGPTAFEADISGGVRSGPETPFRRGPHMLAIILVAVLWILLLAGGALYFGTTDPDRETVGSLFQGWGGSAAEHPVYEIRDVKYHTQSGISGETLSVIRGTVANVGKARSKGIRIQATLLGKDNEALLNKAAFAGNLLDDTMLRNMNPSGIEGFLGKRDGEGGMNRNIPAGKSLPFMVVFFDPPKEVGSFLVKAMDADDHGRIHPKAAVFPTPR